MFPIQIALLHLSQLFKTISLRSVNLLLSFTHFTYLLMKRVFFKCLTPAFSHSVIPFHDSSPSFHGTVSKLQISSAPCQKQSQDLAGFHFSATVVLLQSLSFKYLGERNFVTRKSKYLSLAWLFTDLSENAPLWFFLSDEDQKYPCLFSTIPDIFSI